MFQLRNVPHNSRTETQNTHFMFNNIFSEILPFIWLVEIYDRAEQVTDGDTAISTATNKHTLTHTQDM
jgi:hypothetical protein